MTVTSWRENWQLVNRAILAAFSAFFKRRRHAMREVTQHSAPERENSRKWGMLQHQP